MKDFFKENEIIEHKGFLFSKKTIEQLNKLYDEKPPSTGTLLYEQYLKDREEILKKEENKVN